MGLPFPEFPDLKEAELHIADAVRSMGTKKYEDAFECFQQAAELGSPRGYWGMAFLYDLGKYGVKRDKKKADELNRKAAAAAYAPSAMKYGDTWPDAARAVGLSPAEAKEQLNGRQEGCRRRLCLRTVQHGHHVPERLRRTAGRGQGQGMVPEGGGPG